MARRWRKQREGATGIDRRRLLVGGGAAAGLLIAWGLWPRRYAPNVNAAPGETVFDAFLKIDRTGQIIVIVPQTEMGQGDTTVLPQILADELGADWRTVAVQSAPVGPLYANSLLAREWLGNDWTRLAGDAGGWAIDQYATRTSLMLTDGGTAVPMFHDSYRDAGAAARVLLCKAAAARWQIPWESCDIVNGLISDGDRRTVRIGDVVEEAASQKLPDILRYRQGQDGRLSGQDLPRLDMPSKLDGTHNYAADIRLPDMVYASIRQGPIGDASLRSLDEGAGRNVTGFLSFVKQGRWVAAVGSNWWAANKALDLADPVFDLHSVAVDSRTIDTALDAAFSGPDARRMFAVGDLTGLFNGARTVASEFRIDPALHLAVEPPCATARVMDGGAEIWVATQAPGLARDAVAHTLGLSPAQVTIYPLHAGGSFGRCMEVDAAVQAALIARDVGRPVQLLWSRLEDVIHDRPGAPAQARMAATLGRNGVIQGWSAKLAAPCGMQQTWRRIAERAPPIEAAAWDSGRASALAVAGMELPYSIANWAVDHYPVDVGLPIGFFPANARSSGCFITESFVDELARAGRIEPMSFRIQMLGGRPRLAHCLTSAAAMGGWQGGIAGSGQGLALHMADGSQVAILAEASIESNRLSVRRLVAAVDAGDQVNPDIARQQAEGALVRGIALAMGASVPYKKGLPARALLGRMNLPLLGDIGEMSVEIIRSAAAPTSVGDVVLPAVAPAIANALFTVTGQRFRNLPLLSQG